VHCSSCRLCRVRTHPSRCEGDRFGRSLIAQHMRLLRPDNPSALVLVSSRWRAWAKSRWTTPARRRSSPPRCKRREVAQRCDSSSSSIHKSKHARCFLLKTNPRSVPTCSTRMRVREAVGSQRRPNPLRTALTPDALPGTCRGLTLRPQPPTLPGRMRRARR